MTARRHYTPPRNLLDRSMRTLIHNGTIITPFKALSNHGLIIDGNLIANLLPEDKFIDIDVDQKIDVQGGWITPGLIDIHIHGGNYADTMDANKEAFDIISKFLPKFGVTSFLLTTGSALNSQIDKVIDTFLNYTPPANGAIPLGIHLEGPYLSVNRRGAQPKEHIKEPEPEQYKSWFKSGVVKLMTIAPETKGALELIDFGIKMGVEFSAGHTIASYEEMQMAVDHGLRQVTHLFNGMDPLHHRKPGVVGETLTDSRVYAQLIADGIHVHPTVVKLVLDVKRKERTILISDAIRAAGLGNGQYDLLGQEVSVHDGEARIASGSLAGSILTLDQAVRNIKLFCDLPMKDVIYTATHTPAKSLHLVPERGQLRPGSKADIVIFNQDMEVEITIINGKYVYRK